MKSKRSELKRDDNPGPGSYNANEKSTKEKSPEFRMPQTTRYANIVDEKPGPGTYDMHC